MPDFVTSLPIGFNPDPLTAYLLLQSPPFEWILRRGEGWVMLDVDLSFKDGVTRQVELVIGKYPTSPGYVVMLRFKSDALFSLALVDDVTPTVGRVEVYPPPIGKRI